MTPLNSGSRLSGADAGQPVRAAIGWSAWPKDGLEALQHCPLCSSPARQLLYDGLTDRVFFSAPGRWTLWRCRRCGSAYLDPRPTRETIALAYGHYYTHDSPSAEHARAGALARLRRTMRNGYLRRRFGYDLKPASWLGGVLVSVLPRRAARIDYWIRHLPSAGRKQSLLDVGAGSGGFVAQMRTLGWDAKGLDPDPSAVAAARRSGIPMIEGTLEDIAEEFTGRFDAVTMSHVIEHVHDPIAALRLSVRLLRSGGVLWVATPDLGSIGHLFFGRNWRGLEPPRHLVIFTRDSLEAALNSAGFTDVRSLPMPHRAVYFSESSVIERGADDLRAGVLPPAKILSARSVSWLRGVVFPQAGEEIVMAGQRP